MSCSLPSLKKSIGVDFNGMLPAGVGQVIKGWDIGVNGIWTFILFISNTRLSCSPYFHDFGLVLVSRYAGWWQKEAHHSTFNGVRYPSHWFVSPAVARSNPVLICSSFCRYGSDRVGKIPQNSTLIFDVELVNVKWSWGPRWHEGPWETEAVLQVLEHRLSSAMLFHSRRDLSSEFHAFVSIDIIL